jgi:L-threonylcarbamoyladenylate synthase
MEFSLDKSKNIVVNVLSKGGVVVLPTDTIYALSCVITNENSLNKILAIKGRDISKGIPVLVPNKNYFYKYANNVNKMCEKLIETFLPGALTLIMKKKSFISNIISGDSDNIALRIPNSKNLIKIMNILNSGITGTSANISGKPHSLLKEELAKDLGDKVDMIVFGQYTEKNKNPSTILDLSNNKLEVIREGAITISDIKNAGIKVN